MLNSYIEMNTLTTNNHNKLFYVLDSCHLEKNDLESILMNLTKDLISKKKDFYYVDYDIFNGDFESINQQFVDTYFT